MTRGRETGDKGQGDKGKEERYTEGRAKSTMDQVAHTEVVGTSALINRYSMQYQIVDTGQC